MNVASAIELIQNLVYKPGWSFKAEDHTNRFEGTVRVRIDYPAQNSNRDQAEAGYPEAITTYASFPLIVEDMDDTALYYEIIRRIGEIEVHEAREFLRVHPTCWAPFHPHRKDGMYRWAAATGNPGSVREDLQFGLC